MSTPKSCSECGQVLGATWKVCVRCGHEVIAEQPGYCSNCGTRLPGDVAFCPNCGARVSGLGSATSITQGPALAGEVAYWVSRGYSIQIQTEQEAILSRPGKAASGCLVVFLLLLGIVPGIVYLVWPRQAEVVRLWVDVDGKVHRTGGSGDRRLVIQPRGDGHE